MKRRILLVLNAIGASTAHWALILLASNGSLVWGLLPMLCYFVLHLWISPRRESEAFLIVAVGALGTAFDSALFSSGAVQYAYAYPTGAGLAPLWVTALWAGFAPSLDHSLRFLQRYPWLAAVVGAVFAPLTYAGLSQLGIVVISGSATTLYLVTSLLWGVALPFFSALAGLARISRS